MDAPIQAGEVDNGDEAVGLLSLEGGGFCSATLIAPSIVLTAAHCLRGTAVAFLTGTGRDGADGEPDLIRHTVDGQVAHPDYQGGRCPPSSPDVGLVHLRRSLSTIAPATYATKPPTTASECRTVGFGRHDTSGGRVELKRKREATVSVLRVDDDVIKLRAGSGIADHGDSGGPVFCDATIVGTSSCHDDGNWPQHQEEYSARIDAASAWIGRASTQLAAR